MCVLIVDLLRIMQRQTPSPHHTTLGSKSPIGVVYNKEEEMKLRSDPRRRYQEITNLRLVPCVGYGVMWSVKAPTTMKRWLSFP